MSRDPVGVRLLNMSVTYKVIQHVASSAVTEVVDAADEENGAAAVAVAQGYVAAATAATALLVVAKVAVLLPAIADLAESTGDVIAGGGLTGRFVGDVLWALAALVW